MRLRCKTLKQLKPFFKTDVWNKYRVKYMKQAIHAKFSQNKDLASTLKQTGSKELVEYTEDDSFWGKSRVKLGRIHWGYY